MLDSVLVLYLLHEYITWLQLQLLIAFLNRFQDELLMLEFSPEINLSAKFYQTLFEISLTSERTGKCICLALVSQKR